MGMTYRENVRAAEQRLAAQGIADAAADAWYLLEYVTGMSRTSYLLRREEQMPESEQQKYLCLTAQRAAHIPLQHLTGTQEFMGLSFQVSEHVLIPRQDTEILAEEALGCLRPGMRVLDLCTGSGCIAVSLAKLGPGCAVTGSDLSEEALAVARENGRRHGAAVTWIQSDLFRALSGTFDVIVSNPPYIPTDVIGGLTEEVRLHEPFQALDGHEDGLYFYRKIVCEAAEYLCPGGSLLFEIGHDQGESVSRLMKDAGYTEVRVLRDLAGLDRVVTGVMPA